MTRRSLLIGLTLVLVAWIFPRFDTDSPPACYGQPSHIHFKVQAAGYRQLTTQLYPKGGQGAVAFDLVLVKE